MNAIELLKKNHELLLALIGELAHEIRQLEQTEQDTVDCERMNMFGEFRDTLTQHRRLEEQMFYPELEGFSETRLLVNESYREHKQIRDVLATMESLRKEGHCDRWDDQLKELQQDLLRHITREEDDLFPKAITLLGEARLESVFLRMKHLKTCSSANV